MFKKKRKATNYCVRFGHSLWSAIGCQRKWLNLYLSLSLSVSFAFHRFISRESVENHSHAWLFVRKVSGRERWSEVKRQSVQMICARRTRRLTPSLIEHVGTIRDGSTVCHDMPWLTTEGRTCDDIRDVLGLPRDPSGDNKRTTRTGTCQWTTLYCAEIAATRKPLDPESPSFSRFFRTRQGKFGPLFSNWLKQNGKLSALVKTLL